MKKIIALMMTTLLLLYSAALAQEYVSISELYDQAQAMGGVWQETFETKNGTVTVDVPIIVPEVSQLPVLTVERAKISKDAYDFLTQGQKTTRRKNAFEYVVDIDGEYGDFFLGNVDPEEQSYDAIQHLWIRRGSYRYGSDDWKTRDAEPITYHYPWELKSDEAYLQNREQTIDDVMNVWRKEIERFYPDRTYEIEPKRVTIYGSLLGPKNGKGKVFERKGYYYIDAEQYIEGVPVFGPVANNVSNVNGTFRRNFSSTQKINRIEEKLDAYRAGALHGCDYQLMAFIADGSEHQIMINLLDVRSEEYADIPLASLDEVLENVAKEIEAGHIRQVFSIRLGYLLYSNPDMTDHAWAVPRWVVDCNYITKDSEATVKRFRKNDDNLADIWNKWEFLQMPVDAQSGELIIMTTGDEKTFSVPDIVTWDDV